MARLAWVRRLQSEILLYLALQRSIWILIAVMGLVIPAVLTSVLGQRLDPHSRARLLVGNIVLASMLLSFRQVAFSVCAQRSFGSLELLASSGVSRLRYIAAWGMIAVGLGCAPLVVVLLCPLLGVASPASFVCVGPYLIFCTFLFGSALILTSLHDRHSVVALLANIIAVASWVFLPLSYSPDRISDWLRPVVMALPPSIAAEALSSAWSGESPGWNALGIMSIWATAAIAVGWRRFDWLPRPG